MSEILDFLARHWQVASLFALLLGAYLWFEFRAIGDKTSLSAEQAVALYNHQQAHIFDIRPLSTFKAGHIIGAQELQVDSLEPNFKKLHNYIDKPFVIVCADGKMSAKLVQDLRTHGFLQAYTLEGGMRAWQEAGLPTVTKG